MQNCQAHLIYFSLHNCVIEQRYLQAKVKMGKHSPSGMSHKPTATLNKKTKKEN
jgi:hypothetical protein